jgi:hypothetical protein
MPTERGARGGGLAIRVVALFRARGEGRAGCLHCFFGGKGGGVAERGGYIVSTSMTAVI